MKKTKLIATIMTICLAVCTLAYGVYATTNLSFTVGANIAFEVKNLFVQVNGTVNGAYSDAQTPQTAINNLENIVIIPYNPAVVVSTVNNWDIGTLYFSNSNVNQTIDFVITVVNHTPNTTIGVDITPDATTATAFSNAELIITKTYTDDKQRADNNETIVLTYSLKLPNLTNAVSINNIKLNVAIDKVYTMNLSLNEGTGLTSILYTGTTIQTAPTSPTKSGFNFVGWCSDSTLNNQITFPYTVPQGVTTLYAKWGEQVLKQDANGYYVTMGTRNNNPVKWRLVGTFNSETNAVTKYTSGTPTGKGIFLLETTLSASCAFNSNYNSSTYKHTEEGWTNINAGDYATSTVRRYMNDDYLATSLGLKTLGAGNDTITDSVYSQIEGRTLASLYSTMASNGTAITYPGDTTPNSFTSNEILKTTQDKLWLLNLTEFNKLGQLWLSGYWLATPQYNDMHFIVANSYDRFFPSGATLNQSQLIRPAFLLDI